EYWNTLVNDYGGYLPELEKQSIYDLIKKKESFSLKNTLIGACEFLFHELILNGKLLGLLMMLTLFSVLLQTTHAVFEQSAVSKIAYFVVYIVLLFISLNSFYVTVSYIEETIDTMMSFMIALLPLVLGLMATFGNVVTVSFFHLIVIFCIYFSLMFAFLPLVLGLIATFGNVVTVSFFHPIVIFLIHISGVLVSKFILPLLFLSAILLIVSTLNENHKVTHLGNLFKSVGMGLLGMFLTIFLGVMSVQGAASAIQDGVAMKTTKFITGNFIPVVGRTFTDAADTVLSASLLLKNAVGIVGMVMILLISLFPALKIFAIALMYKIAASVLQPVADGPMITSLNMISKYIGYMLGCLLVVSLMFFLAIVIIVAASNITLLLR